MKTLPRWLVYTPDRIDGRYLRFFGSRAEQRTFAKAHGGHCYDVTKSKH